MSIGFWNKLENYGDKPALICDDEEISYKSLSEISDAITAAIPKRSFVFLICKNRLPSVAAYLGFLRKDIVVLLLNHTIDKEYYEREKQLYQPQFIFCPEDFSDEEAIYGYDGYKLISTAYNQPEMYENLALMISTSGTTGSPKLVRLSYDNIQANTSSIVSFLACEPSDRAITTLPMSYAYGLSIINTHLMTGAAVILTENSVFEKSFVDCFNKYGATNFGAIPYIYSMLYRLSFFKYELPTLRYVTQAGGKLEEDLHYRLAEQLNGHGKKLFVMYGASEATARMSYVPAEMTQKKAGSIGIALPGGRFELIDEKGSVICGSGINGELVYYGPNVMLGYARIRDDLIKGDEKEGRLRTGDIAYRDDDGYYYIIGRKSRFLKIYGHRVNLSEIEEILNKEGYENACAGKDDNMLIYTTSNACEKITSFLSRKTGLDRMSFRVIHVDSIPRNESGKVLYWGLE